MILVRRAQGFLNRRCPERSRVPRDLGGAGSGEILVSYAISDIARFARWSRAFKSLGIAEILSNSLTYEPVRPLASLRDF